MDASDLPIDIYERISIAGGVNILLLDVVALVFFITAWWGYAAYADRQYNRTTNLMPVMNRMRWRWMRQMIKRDNRLIDSTLMGNMLRSISFFANTSIFILIGLITVMGYRDSAIEFIDTIPFSMQSTAFLWEVKLFNLAIIFTYAFFKFTWSLRQYNYCCVLVGAAPFPNEGTEMHEDYAIKAGNLLGNAAQHFNMGLRAYYFGLAAISWFLHPLIFIAVTGWVVYVIYRREFRSQTLNSIAGLGEGY